MVYGPPLYPPPPPPRERDTPPRGLAGGRGGQVGGPGVAALMDDDDDTGTKREIVSITSSTPDTETEDPTDEPTPETTFGDDFTKLVVDVVWEDMTQEDQDAMCLGIEVFGVEWAADEMRDSGEDQDIDWDLAAEVIEDKCAERSTY